MFNANNYGYNPYGRFVPQQPMQQPMQPVEQVRTSLQGKQIESLDVIKTLDVPFDGTISYFPTIDKSSIATKQLQNDGTVKTLIYKLAIEEEEKENPIDFKVLIDDIKEIKEEIKSLKKADKDE